MERDRIIRQVVVEPWPQRPDRGRVGLHVQGFPEGGPVIGADEIGILDG
jgi:hypothetical protein